MSSPGDVSRETSFEAPAPVRRWTRDRNRAELEAIAWDQWGRFLEVEDLLYGPNESIPWKDENEDISAYKEINYDGY